MKKFKFTETITTTKEESFYLDYGVHYLKIEEEDEEYFYKLNLKDEGGEWRDLVDFIKVSMNYEDYRITSRIDYVELPFSVRYYLFEKAGYKGSIISKEEFDGVLNLCIDKIKENV